MEKQIGTTALRQNLTDVIQTIREEKATYVVETFGRPQVAIVDLDQFRNFQAYRMRRERIFDELITISEENAKHNADLSEDEILKIIKQARREVHAENMQKQEQNVD